MQPTDIQKLITDLRNYQLTLDENIVICDRRVVDQAADMLLAMAADLAMRVGVANRLDELEELVIQYRRDLKFPPTGDSLERRIEAIDRAIKRQFERGEHSKREKE